MKDLLTVLDARDPMYEFNKRMKKEFVFRYLQAETPTEKMAWKDKLKKYERENL